MTVSCPYSSPCGAYIDLFAQDSAVLVRSPEKKPQQDQNKLVHRKCFVMRIVSECLRWARGGGGVISHGLSTLVLKLDTCYNPLIGSRLYHRCILDAPVTRVSNSLLKYCEELYFQAETRVSLHRDPSTFYTNSTVISTTPPSLDSVLNSRVILR